MQTFYHEYEVGKQCGLVSSCVLSTDRALVSRDTAVVGSGTWLSHAADQLTWLLRVDSSWPVSQKARLSYCVNLVLLDVLSVRTLQSGLPRWSLPVDDFQDKKAVSTPLTTRL